MEHKVWDAALLDQTTDLLQQAKTSAANTLQLLEHKEHRRTQGERSESHVKGQQYSNNQENAKDEQWGLQLSSRKSTGEKYLHQQLSKDDSLPIYENQIPVQCF